MLPDRDVHSSRRHDRRDRLRARAVDRAMFINVSDAESHGQSVSPFGQMPFNMAGAARKQFSRPLQMGLGFGGGKNSPFAEGKGPLAQYMNQSRGVLGSYLPQTQALAGDITAGANRAYGGYQAAIDSFLAQLPGFQSQMGNASAAAQTNLQDAMSPLGSRASFQEASRRALAPAREGAAARGMLEGGQAQAGEQSLLSDLAFQTMQGDDARKNAAIGQAGEMAGAGAQLAALGPEARGRLFEAYPQLAGLLQAANQMPMDANNQLLQYFTAANDPSYSLLRMILPSVTTASEENRFGIIS
jgi:hypothetical protein